MVSAVFHSPLALAESTGSPAGAARVAAPRATPEAERADAGASHVVAATGQADPVVAAAAGAAPAVQAAARSPFDWRVLALRTVPPLLGLTLLVAVWALVARTSGNIPGPVETWQQAVEVFSDPFYRKGPNDQGIGWNVLMSLQRVGLAAADLPLLAKRRGARLILINLAPTSLDDQMDVVLRADVVKSLQALWSALQKGGDSTGQPGSDL